MVIDGTDGYAGAAHDAFVGEACDVWRDLVGDSGEIEVCDIHLRGKRDGTRTHTSVAADAHVNFETHASFSKRHDICVMRNADDLFVGIITSPPERVFGQRENCRMLC